MSIKSTIGGLAGACTLTLLNEGFRGLDKDAPRMDLLGMNAIALILKGNNILAQTATRLFPLAVAGDLISNALYYSMADAQDKGKTMARGAALGLAAGLGAILLPKVLGLNEESTTRTPKTQVLTVSWYLIGGLAAAASIILLKKIGNNTPAS